TQMIFQDPSSCLNPRLRVRDILCEPFAIHKLLTPDERQKRAAELCDMVGLSRAYLSRYPHEMSGGQKQRVGIARALALEPKLIVCDEPVSALDVSIQAQVLNLLSDLQTQFGFTYLFISHNLSVVKHCCGRIAVMYLGRIVEFLDSEDLEPSCRHPYTKALLGSIFDVYCDKNKEIDVITGEPPSPLNLYTGCPFAQRCEHCTARCEAEMPELKEVAPGHLLACFNA
ncbi:MAG: ATP-binding cassette domain-containing protein, partial [Firmicutes bacterium]|nr:ATP-binding cassette domain-containing protein [Bacillota bacterium]